MEYNRPRTFSSRVSNVYGNMRVSKQTEVLILLVAGILSCLSGYYLNDDTTKITVLSQDISTSTYNWLGYMATFIGSPLIFFAAYLLSENYTMPKSFVTAILILYGVFIAICGYFISQDQATIFNMDTSQSNTFFNIYGWGSVGVGSLMFLYGLYLSSVA